MKISKATLIAIAAVIVFAAQPVVQAGQNLEGLWPIDDERGDSSTGCLTIYYEVVGWNKSDSEEQVLMFFFLRLYEKKTRTWRLISASADKTYSLTQDAVRQAQQIELRNFLNGPVLTELGSNYSSVHLINVENDFHNFDGNKPPYVVGADVTIVAK